MKILKFSRFQIEPVRGDRGLLTVKFLDNNGEAYSWAPKWNDAEQLFLKAINVESFNKPESEWLSSFSRTVKHTAENVPHPVQSAFKLQGRLASIKDGKLQIEQYGNYNEVENVESVQPLFHIGFEFLEKWLDRFVEVLVINDVCVQLRDDMNHEIYPEDRQTNLAGR